MISDPAATRARRAPNPAATGWKGHSSIEEKTDNLRLVPFLNGYDLDMRGKVVVLDGHRLLEERVLPEAFRYESAVRTIFSDKISYDGMTFKDLESIFIDLH